MIYTIEYDGFGDFPQYPLNAFSDVNAFLGLIELHGQYPYFGMNPDLLPMIHLTNTTGPTLTDYYVIPVQNLPLVSPIRAIPIIGPPIADLIQPDLRVIVDLRYGSTTQGWSPDPPNVPTGFGVIPPVSPQQILSALNTGTQQGISAFSHDISNLMSSPPSLSLSGLTSMLGSGGTGGTSLVSGLTSALSSPANFLGAVQAVNTRVVDAVTGSAAATYATLLPTADVVNSLVTTVPSYDINLFLDGMEQMVDGDPVNGLVFALGAPVSADVGILTLFGGFEIRVFQHAASSIVTAITGTSSMTPTPTPQSNVGLYGTIFA